MSEYKWLLPDEVTSFLSVQDLMKILNIGKSAAYELVNTGRIQSVRVGGRIRIPVGAFLKYVEELGYHTEITIDHTKSPGYNQDNPIQDEAFCAAERKESQYG